MYVRNVQALIFSAQLVLTTRVLPPQDITVTYILYSNHSLPLTYVRLLLAATTSFYLRSLNPRCTCSNNDRCLRWKKARIHLGFPGNDCETTRSARQQPDHIHSDGLIYFYVVMLGIIHTCTALRYKPAFIATR